MSVSKLLTNIELGRSGKNIGISTGLPVIDTVIYGIQRKFLYIVGADTSGGKTSFVNDAYIYNLLKNSAGKRINILYYSFEMEASILFAKLLSRYIYDKYSEIITYEEILSLKTSLTDHHYQIIQDSLPWLQELETHLFIYDKALPPKGIYATCKQWLEKFGTFERIDDHREQYILDDPEHFLEVVVDHVSLITGAGTKKERIDETVDYFIYFRNKCGITGILIQQLNRNSKSMERKLNGYELIALDDFKDTSYTTDSADVVIALYYPYREKIPKCEGYPIQNILKGRFRLCQILKNRYGIPDVSKGLAFYGEISMFRELPRPEEISDYTEYLTLNPYKKDVYLEDTQTQTNIFTF